MAVTPQGNFAAYAELKYRKEDQDQSVDFINLGIDRLIKEGKAADAAKLKQAQDLGKTYYDAVKEIKIEPHQSTAMMQGFQNKLFKNAFDKVAEAKRITQDPSVPNEVKQRYSQRALEAQKNYMAYGTFMVDEKQIEAFTNKMKTDTSKIWKGDKSLGFMKAIESNAVTVHDDGSIEYLDPNDPPGSPNRKLLSISEGVQLMMNPYEQDVLHQPNGFYAQLDKEAEGMSIKIINGVGGNRTTETFDFNPEDAKKSFDIRFGTFDLNNKDVYLKQFAEEVLIGGEIKNKEDWDKVKQAYVDTLDIKVKKEISKVDKYTPAQLEGQKADVENTRASTRKLNKPEEPKIPKVTISENIDGIPRIIKASSDGRKQDGEAEVYKGGITINIDKKEPVLAYKTPNANGKGYHVEVAILGKDEDGRAAFKTLTTKSDIATKLAGYGLNYYQFEKSVMRTKPIEKTKVKTSAKTLKEYNQSYEYVAPPEEEEKTTSQRNPNQKYLPETK